MGGGGEGGGGSITPTPSPPIPFIEANNSDAFRRQFKVSLYFIRSSRENSLESVSIRRILDILLRKIDGLTRTGFICVEVEILSSRQRIRKIIWAGCLVNYLELQSAFG